MANAADKGQSTNPVSSAASGTPTTRMPPSPSSPLPGTTDPGQPPVPAVDPKLPIAEVPPTATLGQLVFYNSGSSQYPAIVSRVNQDGTVDLTVFAPETHSQHRRSKEGILSGHWSKEVRAPATIPPKKLDRLHGATPKPTEQNAGKVL